MADKVIMKKSTIVGIGNAIREKEGTTDLIPTAEMEARIRAIKNGGATITRSFGGTEVPNSGLVENVYINSNMSIEEVYSIVSSLKYVTFNNIVMYGIFSNADMTNGLVIVKSEVSEETENGCGYLLMYLLNGEELPFYQIYVDYNTNTITGAYNPDNDENLPNPITFNIDNYIGLIGEELGMVNQNDKLSSLISITPFETETLTIEGTYDGSTLVVDEIPKGGGTKVPNSGYVENIYFNTSLSNDEVYNLIKDLTYTNLAGDMYFGYAIIGSENISIGILKQVVDGITAYQIIKHDSETVYWAYSKDTTEEEAGFKFGWSELAYSPIEIKGEAMTSNDNIVVPVFGVDNDKLTDLVSITPTFDKPNTIDIKSLIENKKRIPLEIKLNLANGASISKWKGTKIPNSGLVEHLYINTDMTEQEVVEILKKLDYTTTYEETTPDDSIYYALSEFYGIASINEDTTFYIEHSAINDVEVYFIKVLLEGSMVVIFGSGIEDYKGWILENMPYNPFPLNSEVISSGKIKDPTTNNIENFTFDFGLQNDKLSSLFSTTAFEKEKISLEGEYKGDKLILNELPKGAEVVPATGFLEKIYFNLDLTPQEVIAELKKLPTEVISNYSYSLIKTVTASDGGNAGFLIMVSDVDGVETAGIMWIRGENSSDITDTIRLFYYPYSENLGFEGWNPEFDGIINVNRELAGTQEGSSESGCVGLYNDLLINLCSATSTFGKPNIINIEDMIKNEKHIPLEIEVNIESGSTLKKLLDYTKSCGSMFSGNTTITDLTGYFEYSDTENVTSMMYMFESCTQLTSIPQLDTSNVTNMKNMFISCGKLTEVPQLDTSNVTDMSSMFNGCTKLTTIPQLDTSKVTSMNGIFGYCYNLTTIPLLDTSNVTNMAGMFRNCGKLTEVPQLDTSKVTSMMYMFSSCTQLTSIPQLDTSNVTNMNGMFDSCTQLTTIPQLDMINNKSFSDTFRSCTNLTNLTLLNIKWNLTIGSGRSYGHYLTLESLLNTCQECINVSASRTLTVGSANLEKLASVYVKLTGEAEVDETLPKLPMVQCESTDEGAMLVEDYMALKSWSLA